MEELELEWTVISDDEPEYDFVQDALERIDIFQSREDRIASFEPSNFFAAAGILRAIRQQGLSPGNRFCEWGSGFGVVSCLAAMAGFDACGIEIETNLIDSARQLAEDYGLDVHFQQGSYRPDNDADRDNWATAFSDRRAFSPFNHDLIYIYPWPAEAALTEGLFHRFAGPGSLLLSYMGGGGFRLRRRRKGVG